MPGLYPTVVASLVCGTSAFLAPRATMASFAAGATLRRTSTAAASLRLLRGGATDSRMSSEHFDYLVIGGGSGGVASARRAATYNAKVHHWSLCNGSYSRLRTYSVIILRRALLD